MRWGRRSGTRTKPTRFIFATDIHGSEDCFRKWVNAARILEADCLLLGGDITGKSVVPLVERPEGVEARLGDSTVLARDDKELIALRRRIRAGGRYVATVTPEEHERVDSDPAFREELFQRGLRECLRGWVAVAEERLPATGTPAFFMLGNDDEETVLDDLASDSLRYAEHRVCELPGGYEMISFGYSTPTPWHTPRELAEETMAERIEALAGQVADPGRAIFNLHCPPRDTHLDQAPVLDEDLRPRLGAAGTVTGSVGSTAVRGAIERHQPLLGLHGHVHECPAVESLGSTFCVNAGSEYQDGVLRAAVIELADGEVSSWQLINS